MDGGGWWAAVHVVAESWTRLSFSLSLFTFMHWRRKWWPTPVFLPGESKGKKELGGLPSRGSHRVGHDWNDLAAAAVFSIYTVSCLKHLPVPWASEHVPNFPVFLCQIHTGCLDSFTAVEILGCSKSFSFSFFLYHFMKKSKWTFWPIP